MLTNRRLKNMLIDQFADGICFTYPKDRKRSKVFHTHIAEILRSNDPVQICAEKLRNECEQFDFLLEGSFRIKF